MPHDAPPETIGPVTTVATSHSRDYITPEDVSDAMRAARESPVDPFLAAAEVRHEVLTVLGNTTGWGAEDRDLCAFVAASESEVDV